MTLNRFEVSDIRYCAEPMIRNPNLIVPRDGRNINQSSIDSVMTNEIEDQNPKDLLNDEELSFATTKNP